MKKLVVTLMTLTFLVSGGVGLASAKSKKAVKKAEVQCSLDGKTTMVTSNQECMNMGGLVMNYPGPDADKAPAKKAKKKAM